MLAIKYLFGQLPALLSDASDETKLAARDAGAWAFRARSWVSNTLGYDTIICLWIAAIRTASGSESHNDLLGLSLAGRQAS